MMEDKHFLCMRDYFIVIVILLCSKSLYYETFGQNILLIPLLLSITFIAFQVKKFTFNSSVLVYIFAFLSLLVINNNTQISSLFILCLRFFICLILIRVMSFTVFSTIFSKTMFALGVLSLASFPVIYFNIPSLCPDFIATDGRLLRNFIFFGVWENFIEHGIYRNSGLWWEPGAFAVFFNLGVMFMIINNQLTKVKYILSCIIVLTIQSTTGFIVFILLSIMGMGDLKKRSYLVFLFFSPIIIWLIGAIVLPSIFEKFSDGNLSFLSRYYDFMISMHMFKEHFLIGYGFGAQINNAIPFGISLFGVEKYQLVSPTGADGITMLIAQMGVFCIFLLIPVFYPKYLREHSIFDRFLVAIALLFMLNTENVSFLIIFTVLTFYGIVGNREFKSNNMFLVK